LTGCAQLGRPIIGGAVARVRTGRIKTIQGELHVNHRVLGIVAIVTVAAATTTYAQPGAAPANPTPVGKPIMVGMPPGAGGAWNMSYGFGGMGMSQVLMIVTDLNMTPDFTLAADQKTRIAAIRDDYKKAFEAWQKDNQDKLNQNQKDMAAAFKDQDKDAITDAGKAMTELYKTAPQAKDLDEKIMAVLTADQKKAVEDTIAKRHESRREVGTLKPR
jgi:Spy/CpxP family protein refolding chaperone